MNAMTEVYLFDWGDTLMVDFPGVPGKMCNWERVAAVEGAEEALSCISKKAQVYIATGAAESTEVEIKTAFNRVGLDKYITGYFCKSNIGIEKGTTAFLSCILAKLGKQPNQVTMVGDSLKKDIEPAQLLGINTVWFSNDKTSELNNSVRIISSLKELCQLSQCPIFD
jgi:putative hydrolase of the HAD superfamily